MIPDNENDVDYDNERESYNSSEELMPSALPLFSPDEFEEGDEISIQASKYLQKVREEAKNIVFKTNTNKKLRIPNSRSNFPKDYLIADEINLFDEIEHYDQEWKFNTIKNFEILYKELVQLKLKYENQKSLSEVLINEQTNIFNIDSFISNLIFMGNFEEKEIQHQISPSFSVLVCIDNIKAINLLNNIVENFSDLKSYFLYNQALWIFSLLLCIEKPLLIETCGILTEIMKILIFSMKNYNVNNSDYIYYIGMVNILLCIIKYYFEL